MSKSKLKSGKRIQAARRSLHRGIPLDEAGRENINLTVLLLKRRGFSDQGIRDHFEASLASTPAWVGEEAGVEQDDLEDIPGEVLTRWHRLRRYTSKGRPRPLPARGRLSVTSLIRSINRRVDPHAILKLLTVTSAVERHGALYLPKEREMPLRNDPHSQRVHHLRANGSLLRTLEGNVRQQEQWRHMQRLIEGEVPLSELDSVIKELKEHASQLAEAADSVLARYAEHRIPESQKRRIFLGFHFGDDRPLPPLSGLHRPQGKG